MKGVEAFMNMRRNFFFDLSAIVYVLTGLYAVSCAWNWLGEDGGMEFPWGFPARQYGGLLPILLLLLLILMVIAAQIYHKIATKKQTLVRSRWLLQEPIIYAVALLVGACLRFWYIACVPMEPQSDFQVYYEVANRLMDGTLKDNGGLCGYIAMFPHIIGYPTFLSIIFRVFGNSIFVAKSTNILLNLLAAVEGAMIAKELKGRTAGVLTLILLVFWPSQILYINILGAEYLFTAICLGCILMFVKKCAKQGKPEQIKWAAFLGVGIGICSFVRPMALLLLISILICFISSTTGAPVGKAGNNFLGKMCWKSCIAVLVAYLVIGQLSNVYTKNAIGEATASGKASFGYNLLVGTNVSTYGSYSDEDMKMLAESFAQTESATEAHETCMKEAMKRISSSPYQFVGLMGTKFNYLWGNDDYGAWWNLQFGGNNMTSELKTVFYALRNVSDFYYIIVYLLAIVGGLFIGAAKPDGSYVVILMILGTMAMHLVVESQNRYHFHTIPLIAILAAVGLVDLVRHSNAKQSDTGGVLEKSAANIERIS